jgi:hypothetical protein
VALKALEVVKNRVARFVLIQHTKIGNYIKAIKYEMVAKYSKWSQNIPTFIIPRPSKINQNCDFWYKNKPSGNPG